MVYKKYVKVNGKICGPYYYESYREDGKVKKRYLGTKLKKKSSAKTDYANLVFIGIILILAILLFYFLPSKITPYLLLEIDEQHSSGESLSGNLSLVVEPGHFVDRDTKILIRLIRNGVIVDEANIDFEDFLSGQAEYIETEETVGNCSTEEIVSCINETQEVENCVEETSCENVTNTIENCETPEPVCTEETETVQNCHDENGEEVCEDETNTIETCDEPEEVCTNETEITEECSSEEVETCTNETEITEECSSEEVETCTNETESSYFYGAGDYSRQIADFIDYSLEAGEYSLEFEIPSLDLDTEKSFEVDETSADSEEILSDFNGTASDIVENTTEDILIANETIGNLTDANLTSIMNLTNITFWTNLTNMTNSTNVTRIVMIQAAGLSSVSLTSTFGTNMSNENLTVVTDQDSNPSLKLIRNWYLDNYSIFVLNMPFEGGSNGTFAKDYSGYSNNGSVSGATWDSNGGYDGEGVYQFDGSDEITIPDSDSLSPSEAITIESRAFLSDRSEANTSFFDHMTVNYWDKGTIVYDSLWQSSQGLYTQTAIYNLTNWSYDPVYSYDITAHFYIMPYGTNCYAQLNLGIMNLTYNRDSSCAGGSGGYDFVDIVNKSNYIRHSSSNDIKGNHTWRLLYYNNGTYSVFKDGSFYVGGVATLPSATNFQIKARLNNERIQIDYINITQIGGTSANVTEGKIISKSGSYELGSYQNGSIPYVYGTINENRISLSANFGWNHIVLTYDKNAGANQQKFYINGVLAGEETLTASIVQNSEDVLIGTLFNSKIDDVKIYNRSLSDVQINELYNGNTNKIVSEELHAGDAWQVCVTPNDEAGDNVSLCSNSLTINSKILSASLVNPTSEFNVYNGTSFIFSSNVSCIGGCGNVSAYLDPYPVLQEEINLSKGVNVKVIFAIVILAVLLFVSMKFIVFGWKIMILLAFGTILIIALLGFVKITGFAAGNMISTVPASPFYTTGDNPQSCEIMDNGETCSTSWTVFATGESGEYAFNVYYNSTDTDVTGITTSSVNVIIQSVTPPSLEIVSPSNQSYTNATVLINISSGGYYTLYSFDGINLSYTSPILVTFSEGSNELIAWTNDTSGSDSSTSVVFSVDTTPPSILINTPQNVVYNNFSQLVNISSTGNYIWFFNGTSNETYSSPVIRTFSEGNNELTAWANDTNGNINWTSVAFSISTNSPGLEILSPSNTTYTNSSVLVSISALETSVWFFNGTENETYTEEEYKEFIEGSNMFNVWVNDSVGNLNFSSVNFIIDTTNPIVKINSPTAVTYTTSTTSVNIGLNEPGYCVYSLNSGATNYSLTANSSNSGFTGTTASLSNSAYTLRAFCNDSVGNVNNSLSIPFSISVSSGDTGGGGGGGGGETPTVPAEEEMTIPTEETPTVPVEEPKIPVDESEKEEEVVCAPNIICGAWGVCEYDSSSSSIFDGTVTYLGKRTRVCEDENKCIAGNIEQEECSVTAEVVVKEEIVNEQEVVLVSSEVVSASGSGGGSAGVVSNKTVAFIDKKSWKQNGSLKMVFSDAGQESPDSCFDGIINGDETKIDCGGVCGNCTESRAPFSINLPWILLVLLVMGLTADIIKIFSLNSSNRLKKPKKQKKPEKQKKLKDKKKTK